MTQITSHIAPSQTRRRKDTKDSRSHRTVADLTQRRRDAEAQSHHSGDSRSTGRTAPACSRGIEAQKADRQTHAFVESTFRTSGRAYGAPARPRWIGEFRHAVHTPIQRRNDSPSPVTLSTTTPRGDAYSRNDGAINTCHSERTSPRESRRIPRGSAGRISICVAPNFGGFFDSLCSLRMTVLVRPCPPPQWRPVLCSAGVPPEPHTLMQAYWIRVLSTSHRRRDAGATKKPGPLWGRHPACLSESKPKTPRSSPLKKSESPSPTSPRRSRCAPSTAAVGSGWRNESELSERQPDSTMAAVGDRRRLRRLDRV